MPKAACARCSDLPKLLPYVLRRFRARCRVAAEQRTLTDRPGLGVELDEAAAEKYLRPGTRLFA